MLAKPKNRKNPKDFTVFIIEFFKILLIMTKYKYINIILTIIPSNNLSVEMNCVCRRKLYPIIPK